MYRRIRDMREDADLLQKDVADYLQCTQVSYSHYELGKRDIPTDVLIRVELPIINIGGVEDETIPCLYYCRMARRSCGGHGAGGAFLPCGLRCGL